jgi:T-complex protein 1 subunit theta
MEYIPLIVGLFNLFIMPFQACIQVCPKNPANFNVDNVRVAKLVGGGLHNSSVVRGLVLKNDAVGSIKRVEKAKVS